MPEETALTAPTPEAIAEVPAPPTSITRRASEIVADAQLVQQVMRSVMLGPSKENPVGVHYGTIPGTPKPTLYKAGAEKLASVFRLAIEPRVTDCSVPDEIRFRVEARVTSMVTGNYLGSGIGECSTNEAKYRWRGAVSDREYAATPADRKRVKFGRAKDGTQDVQQVRTDPADLAGTVLKMAKKRALVDAVLTVTAASDIFAQDLEDLDDVLRQSLLGHENQDPSGKPPVRPPTRKSDATKPSAAEPDAIAAAVAAGRVAEGYVMDVGQTTGTNAAGPYTVTKAKVLNEWFSTFSASEGKLLLAAKAQNTPVKIAWQPKGDFKNIVAVKMLADEFAGPAAGKPAPREAGDEEPVAADGMQL